MSRVLEPRVEALVLGLHLRLGHVRLDPVLFPLETDLLRLARHRADHERGDGHEDAHDHVEVVYSGLVEQAEQALQVAHVVRAGGRPGADELDRPHVPAQGRPGPVGERAEVGPPVTGRLGHLDLRLDRVQHQVEQFLLGGDVPVEGHDARVELPRDAPHADRFRALGVGHRDGGADDLVPGQPAVAARRLRPPRPVPLDVPGDPLLAGVFARRLAGAQVLAPVPEVRRLLVVLVRTVCLARLRNPAHLPVRLHHAPLLLVHCVSAEIRAMQRTRCGCCPYDLHRPLAQAQKACTRSRFCITLTADPSAAQHARTSQARHVPAAAG